METRPLQALKQALKKYDLASTRFVLAISGGVDSIVLLEAALRTIPKGNLCIAHFDHGTRGGESKKDAHFVKALAKKKGIIFFLGNRVGPSLSEAALRQERFAFLEKAARDFKAEWILLGHHLDDQIETVFFRLIRGTSLSGISGTQEKNGKYLRPFLKIPKRTLFTFAKAKNLPYREDLSNTSPHYFRNRIRHELLPVFKELAGSHGNLELWEKRFIALTKESAQYKSAQKKLVQSFLKSSVSVTPYWSRFSLASFLALPKKDQCTVAHGILQRATKKEVGRRDAVLFQKALKEGCNGRFPGQIHLTCSLGTAFLSTAEQRALLLRVQDPNHFVELCGKTSKKLHLRFPKPGDRRGSTKLKKLFLEKRIPQPERCIIPVLAKPHSSDIVWFLSDVSMEINPPRVKFPYSFLSSASR